MQLERTYAIETWRKSLQRKSDVKVEPISTEPVKEEVDATKTDVNVKPVEESMKKHKVNAIHIFQCSNATPIRCHLGRGYACCFCEDQYPNPGDLKKHTVDTHDVIEQIASVIGKDSYRLCIKLDITALQCKICKENIDTVELLIDHLMAVHDKKMYTDVKHQILPFKFDSDVLKCFICQNVFNKFKALMEHMSVHYRNFNCDKCDTGFVNRKKLYFHMAGHKTGVFKCEHCPKVFNTNLKKKAHEYQAHIHSKRNKCRYCDDRFSDTRQKDMHLERVHGVPTFARKCQACDKTFAHQNALLIHMKRHHLIERPNKCNQCEKAFFSSTELRAHMVKHTGQREFQCVVCSKSYGRKWTLTEHMRIHADDRRFKCEHCNMAFVQKCSWRGHMRSKHGEMD
ncbi:uncharacterized protein [Epargyreus clarus]|uniref:uncharacterized protein n=1 Tax=Epargyreus clarus TaxID=520877 RepID=UPI003C2C6FB0